MKEQIKVLAILPELNPSSIILVIEPLMYLYNLGKIELRILLEKLNANLSDMEWADIVVFCRNTEPAYAFVAKLLSLGKPYVYELDDNFFELSTDTPEGRYYRTPERLAELEIYIRNANLVRVYSSPLESSVRKYTSHVKFVYAPVNLSSIPTVTPQRNSSKVKIVFPTSRTISDSLSQIFIKDIVRIIQEHNQRVEFHFWGFIPDELKGLPSVKFHRFMPNYQKYMQTIYKEGYDIGLAPMVDDLFHNSKTNNKFREYGACWIAGIYSNTPIYSSCVMDGKTGLLVSNEEGAWYQAIIRLMNAPLFRQAIQEQAHSIVEQEYSLDAFALSLADDMQQILATHVKPLTSNGDHGRKKRTTGKRDIWKAAVPLFQILKIPISVINKLQKSVRNYGWIITFRLILAQIERYIYYFELSRQIRRKKI